MKNTSVLYIVVHREVTVCTLSKITQENHMKHTWLKKGVYSRTRKFSGRNLVQIFNTILYLLVPPTITVIVFIVTFSL
jgi:hypothetical protein